MRRLLAFKRHEQPGPRYFNDFAPHVLARIRAGEAKEKSSFSEALSWEAPWLQRLWAAFETKPILAAALGVFVCALLVSGVVLSEKSDNSSPVAELPTPAQPVGDLAHIAPASSGSSIAGIDPNQSSGSLFGGLLPSAQPVNFVVPGGN